MVAVGSRPRRRGETVSHREKSREGVCVCLSVSECVRGSPAPPRPFGSLPEVFRAPPGGRAATPCSRSPPPPGRGAAVDSDV